MTVTTRVKALKELSDHRGPFDPRFLLLGGLPGRNTPGRTISAGTRWTTPISFESARISGLGETGHLVSLDLRRVSDSMRHQPPQVPKPSMSPSTRMTVYDNVNPRASPRKGRVRESFTDGRDVKPQGVERWPPEVCRYVEAHTNGISYTETTSR